MYTPATIAASLPPTHIDVLDGLPDVRGPFAAVARAADAAMAEVLLADFAFDEPTDDPDECEPVPGSWFA